MSFTSPAIIILFIQLCWPVCSAATEALKRRDLLQRHLVLSDSPDLFFFFFVPPKRSWGKRCVEDGVKEERVVCQRGRFPWLWCIIVPLLDVTRGKGQTWCLCGDFQPGPACTMASAVSRWGFNECDNASHYYLFFSVAFHRWPILSRSYFTIKRGNSPEAPTTFAATWCAAADLPCSFLRPQWAVIFTSLPFFFCGNIYPALLLLKFHRLLLGSVSNVCNFCGSIRSTEVGEKKAFILNIFCALIGVAAPDTNQWIFCF